MLQLFIAIFKPKTNESLIRLDDKVILLDDTVLQCTL